MSGVPFLLTIELDGGEERLRHAARVQILARKYGFKPVWLLGVQALRHPAVVEPIGRWQAEGAAEVGVLLEASELPPLVPLAAPRPTLMDFPDSVVDEKLAWLTETFTKAVGRRPVTIRCRPAAVDDRYYQALHRHGYKVDLTVVPHAKLGRSDFTGYSEKAYLTPQGIFEIPRTVRPRRHGAFVEDLLKVPVLGTWAARLFPPLRCLRVVRGSRSVGRLVQDVQKAGASHLDLRVGVSDWNRGERLLRDLENILAEVQTGVSPLTAEEFLSRHKNEQLRKGLV